MIHIDLPAKSVSLVLLLFAFSILPAIPQDQCGFGSEESANKLEASLHNAPSCKAAAKLFDECRWGSSADVSFGAIVAEKCKREYLNKLTPAQKKVHDERIELCNYQYEHQEGTLAISETTSCHIDVAVGFATDAVKAATPLPRASFDCAYAVTPLEKVICSDKTLGRADLILGRVYAMAVKSAKGADRAALIQNEKKWLRQIPSQFGLSAQPASAKVLACLRDQFESRFDLLDGCSVGDDLVECLSPAT